MEFYEQTDAERISEQTRKGSEERIPSILVRVSGRDGDYKSGALENSPVATVGEKGDISPSRCIGDELVDVFSHYHVVIAIMKSQPNSFGAEPHCLLLSCLL